MPVELLSPKESRGPGIVHPVGLVTPFQTSLSRPLAAGDLATREPGVVPSLQAGRTLQGLGPPSQWRIILLIHSQVLLWVAGRSVPNPESMAQTSPSKTRCQELANPPKQRKTHLTESPCGKHS